jgi:hypothetical protein
MDQLRDKRAKDSHVPVRRPELEENSAVSSSGVEIRKPEQTDIKENIQPIHIQVHQGHPEQDLPNKV